MTTLNRPINYWNNVSEVPECKQSLDTQLLALKRIIDSTDWDLISAGKANQSGKTDFSMFESSDHSLIATVTTGLKSISIQTANRQSSTSYRDELVIWEYSENFGCSFQISDMTTEGFTLFDYTGWYCRLLPNGDELVVPDDDGQANRRYHADAERCHYTAGPVRLVNRVPEYWLFGEVVEYSDWLRITSSPKLLEQYTVHDLLMTS